jgi:hypothetical protein
LLGGYADQRPHIARDRDLERGLISIVGFGQG